MTQAGIVCRLCTAHRAVSQLCSSFLLAGFGNSGQLRSCDLPHREHICHSCPGRIQTGIRQITYSRKPLPGTLRVLKRLLGMTQGSTPVEMVKSPQAMGKGERWEVVRLWSWKENMGSRHVVEKSQLEHSAVHWLTQLQQQKL